MYNRPIRDRNTKVCMSDDVPDVITAFKFDVDRFRGFRSQMVWKSGSSIEKASRHYNSSALPYRLWYELCRSMRYYGIVDCIRMTWRVPAAVPQIMKLMKHTVICSLLYWLLSTSLGDHLFIILYMYLMSCQHHTVDTVVQEFLNCYEIFMDQFPNITIMTRTTM